VAGPMDEYSHLLANRLVGNDASAAALEITLIGPEISINVDAICAVAGAAFSLTAGDELIAMHRAFTLRAGVRLKFGTRGAGARATFAVRGGLDAERLFGSRATSLISRLGPFGGRPLKAGDLVPIGDAAPPDMTLLDGGLNETLALPMPAGGAHLRVLQGPQEHLFAPKAYETLYGSRYTITPSSNRMGYRLEGPVLAHAGSADILSDATPLGSIQVPASGQPILLMADRQTTGGYPKIATVISADVPVAGQLAPGDWIQFVPCTRAAAIDALKARFRRLGIAARLAS